jgi:hypothetical protein
MSLLATHFSNSPIPLKGWIPLPFMSRYEGDERTFYYNFDTKLQSRYTLAYVNECVVRGKVISLEEPCPIEGKYLWLTPQGDIWLARQCNAESDPEKRIVARMPH